MTTANEARRANLLLLRRRYKTLAALNRLLDRDVRDSTLSQIVNRAPQSESGTPRQMGSRLARDIEQRLGLPVGWMDQPHDNDAQAVATVASGSAALTPTDEHANQAQALSLRPGEMLIPQHEGVHPRMGPAEMGDNEVITYIRVSEEGLRRTLAGTPITHLAALRLVTARGFSMQPTFRHGDPLLVDTGVQHVELDGVYVLRGPDGAQVKRVQKRRDGLLLISDNKTYEPELVAREDTAAYQVLGRVVYVWAGTAV